MAKTRSPNYPAISLREAIDRLRAVYAKERHGKMEAQAAVRHMGYSGINGASLGILSALKKYGLLQGDGQTLRITPDGLTLVVDQPGSPERQAAIRRAAFTPSLFAELHEQFGDQVPSEDTLRIYLQKQQFIPTAAATAAKTYSDTVQLVSSDGGAYNTPGVDHDEGSDTMHASQQVTHNQTVSTASSVHAIPGEMERLRLPLKNGRTVRLIFSGSIPTQDDITKLIALLELTKDTFPKADPAEAEIEVEN
jgi:hypothetical protein